MADTENKDNDLRTTNNNDGTVTIRNDSQEKDLSNNAAAANPTQIDLDMEPDPPRDMSVKPNDLIERGKYLSRMKEKGIIGEKTGSSVVVREDGQINLSSGKYSQYKLNPNGRTSELSIESKITTNRRVIESDDLVINNHKINPQLWELTDFKQVSLPYTEKAIIGNMTMQAHILVKAWDYDLGRYMLIRRPARVRLFSPRINMPDIHAALGINDPLKVDEDILALTDKGYQVNAAISDSKSLIGKEGVNRDSSWSDEDTMEGTGGQSGAGGTGGAGAQNSGTIGGGNIDTDVVFKTLKSYGYNTMAACAIMGNIQQESGFNTRASNGGAYIGLCQWDCSGRWANCVSFAQSSGRDPYDGLAQLDFMYYEATNTRYPEQDCPAAMNKRCDEKGLQDGCINGWLQYFEGALGQEEDKRFGYAQQFYDKYKDK